MLLNNNSNNYNSISNSLLTTDSFPFNTALGVTGLAFNPTGSRNAALGYHALNAVTTGGSSTAVGYLALGSNSTGLNNSALGNLALAANASGSNNTALGASAGSGYSGSESNNIAIGAGVIGTSGESAVIRIGATATMTRSFVAGIYGTISTRTDNVPMIIDSQGQIGTLGPLLNGQLIIGSAGDNPVAATLTAGTNITITNGPGSISISALSDLVYPIVVSQGGTGRSSLTSHALLIGAGTTPVALSNLGTNGQVLIGAGGADPAFGTITSTGSTLTFTTSAGGLNIDVTSPLVVSYGGTGQSSLTNHGILIGQGTMPIVSSTLTNGQLLIGSTSVDPVAATLSPGTGISITNAPGGITIASTGAGFPWSSVTVSATASSNRGYIVTSGTVTITLPTVSSVGDHVAICLYGGNQAIFGQGTVQNIQFGGLQTTTGTVGQLVSTTNGDLLDLLCVGASTNWIVYSSQGNWNIV